MAIQVNGKVRDQIEVAKDMDAGEIEALALKRDRVQKSIEGLNVRKVIVVPNRIVNVVAG